MNLVWKVIDFEDKKKNVVRLIYSKYSKKKDRISLVKRLLAEIRKEHKT